VPRVLAALNQSDRRTAALRPYRALLLPWARRGRPLRPALGAPRVPLLALHGRDDGCMSIEVARLGGELLEPGHFVEIPDAGHFLALERPEAVAEPVRTFLSEMV
jgi:pimeloyl-ACP methyl ester carboxylesterase